MDENMDYIPEEGYTEDPAPDDMAVPEETGVEAAPPEQEEPGDIEERIDDFLDQIGADSSCAYIPLRMPSSETRSSCVTGGGSCSCPSPSSSVPSSGVLVERYASYASSESLSF